MTVDEEWKHLWSELPPRANRDRLESPIEKVLISRLEKYLQADVLIVPQYTVTTDNGRFRLDFLLEHGNDRIAIECDGEEFHDEWRDEWRDALILGSSIVSSIHRFRGKDIHAFTDDCIYLIYCDVPSFFSARYHQIYEGLASHEIRESQLRGELSYEDRTVTYYYLDDEEKVVNAASLRSQCRKPSKRGHWQVLLRFASQHKGAGIDKLMALYDDAIRPNY